MNPTLERLYQEIGLSALSSSDGLQGKLLIYSEVEDGVVSVDLLYEDDRGNVRFRFGDKNLREIVYSFWIHWQDQPGNREWRVMCCTILHGQFEIDLIYPEQTGADEALADRRLAAIKKHFGDLEVDYSKP